MIQRDLPSDPAAYVAAVLEWAVKEGATDIHFSPLAGDGAVPARKEGAVPASGEGAVPARRDGIVRARLDGILRDAFPIPELLVPRVVSRLKVLADLDIAKKQIPQDGRISFTVDGRPVDFRFSSLPTLHGESVVLRVLDRAAGLHRIDQLRMSPAEARQLRSLVSAPGGLVVVTGPTGAGKTTTLYAALGELAGPERNVVTIEDPIEYEIPRVLQTAAQPRLGITFASLLRSILRHDPDVIMVGEVRDAETAQIAVRAALTGHLVLTSLHTHRAAEAVGALLNLAVEAYALAPALRGVVAQQLVRAICPHCRESFEYGDGVLGDPDFARVAAPGITPSFSIGRGCDACFGSGYRGRRAIFEILTVDDAIRARIARGESALQIEEAAVAAGLLTLRQKAFKAVLEGVTTAEEVVRAVHIE